MGHLSSPSCGKLSLAFLFAFCEIWARNTVNVPVCLFFHTYGVLLDNWSTLHVFAWHNRVNIHKHAWNARRNIKGTRNKRIDTLTENSKSFRIVEWNDRSMKFHMQSTCQFANYASIDSENHDTRKYDRSCWYFLRHIAEWMERVWTRVLFKTEIIFASESAQWTSNTADGRRSGKTSNRWFMV